MQKINSGAEIIFAALVGSKPGINDSTTLSG